jgi:hypothetical protein
VLTSVGRLTVSRRDAGVSIGPDGSLVTPQGVLARLRLVRFDDLRKLNLGEGGLFLQMLSRRSRRHRGFGSQLVLSRHRT